MIPTIDTTHEAVLQKLNDDIKQRAHMIQMISIINRYQFENEKRNAGVTKIRDLAELWGSYDGLVDYLNEYIAVERSSLRRSVMSGEFTDEDAEIDAQYIVGLECGLSIADGTHLNEVGGMLMKIARSSSKSSRHIDSFMVHGMAITPHETADYDGPQITKGGRTL